MMLECQKAKVQKANAFEQREKVVEEEARVPHVYVCVRAANTLLRVCVYNVDQCCSMICIMSMMWQVLACFSMFYLSHVITATQNIQN